METSNLTLKEYTSFITSQYIICRSRDSMCDACLRVKEGNRVNNGSFLIINLCAGEHNLCTMASEAAPPATSKQAITALLTEHFRYTPLVSGMPIPLANIYSN